MAGFWHLSHHQMRDLNGNIYANAKAYFYEADSLTPVVTYQDYGLGTVHPNPVAANAYGVFPPVFFDEADGFYRQRITSAGGVIIPGTDVGTLPIIGPTGSGGGAEVPVDPNAIFQTGFVLWLDQSGSLSGWVRDNGRTVGSATSGASERANSDTEALFLFLWNTYSDTICAVSGGRGVSGAVDWSANKTITLPDKRGYVPGGLDDMGNTAASRYSGIPIIQGSVTTAGSLIGETKHTLEQSELSVGLGTAASAIAKTGIPNGVAANVTRGRSDGTVDVLGPAAEIGTLSVTTTITNPLGGNGHPNVQRTVLGTYYRKL
jgi:hypothetical protein